MKKKVLNLWHQVSKLWKLYYSSLMSGTNKQDKVNNYLGKWFSLFIPAIRDEGKSFIYTFDTKCQS